MQAASGYDRVLIHYSEIGIKGGNRPMFEARLRKNLEAALRGLGTGKVRRESGRFSAPLDVGADPSAVLDRVCQVPGVAWCAPARVVASDVEEISQVVVDMAVAHPDSTFRVSARRSDKSFPMDSLAVNRQVGAAVVEATGRRVSLDHAEYGYGVEIDRGRTYVYWDRREGLGGLPVGSEGLLVAMVSGGIDSPVAAFRMMVRGCRTHLVHFLNRSVATSRVVEKITALAERLSLFHGPLDLSIVPFEGLQREIVMVVPAKFRMLVYRRMMFRIAEAIREEVGALGFVTGDSVGQVASQTLENLRVIYEATDWPVYSPLCGMTKAQITDLARRIGTYETSIIPHEDCCSFLVAKHPATKADLDQVLGLEVFDVEAGVRRALEGVDRRAFRP
ncbi:MAG: tRNA uracil 4-sulfurtransferase ThiI [Planctomycetota bacterium]|jgi:thiamine biosynthesis protein ThiI